MRETKVLLRYLQVGAFITICAVAGPRPSAGQANFRVVAYMNGALQEPIGVTEGTPGVFYTFGGLPNQSVFSVTMQGSTTVLTSFASAHNIEPFLVTAANQRLYSAVTYMLNPVNVFSVASTPGSEKLYPGQTVGFGPTQNLPDGTLLGTSATISAYPSWYLSKCDLKGNVKTFYAFPSTETLPHAAIYASDGNYYGISMAQDTSGYVYRVTPSGTLTKLYNFPTNTFLGVPLYVPLLQASDGNLYGTTASDVSNAKATFYRLTLSGQYTLLYTFPQGANYEPSAMIEGSDGNFYASTLGVGSKLIRLTKSGQYTELYTMVPARDGQCQCQLTQGSDGIIYGSAQGQGATGGGDIFALDAGLPKPAPRAPQFRPSSGPVGTKVLIWGYNLLSATVQFNGVPSVAVTSSGPNYVWATVPLGAGSGPITVTTPGGTVTTQASFTVN